MNRFMVGALAAAAASGGDLLMLYVVGTERADLGLAPAGSWMLPLAYYLGVLGIPLYAVGYAALAVTLARDAPRASRTILIVGTILGVLGAVLHGVTGAAVDAQLRAGADFPDPVEGLLVFGQYILPLWTAVGLLGLLASGAYVYAVMPWRHHGRRRPRSTAAARPSYRPPAACL